MFSVNRSLIDSGLNQLAQGIGPFVERHFKKAFNSQAKEKALYFAGLTFNDYKKRDIEKWDAYGLLKVITESPLRVFNDELEKDAIAYASELLVVRNRLAHEPDFIFTNELTLRALDTMCHLLDAVSSPKVDEVKDIRKRLQDGNETGNDGKSLNESAEPDNEDEIRDEFEQEMKRAEAEANVRRRLKENLLDEKRTEDEIDEFLQEIEKGKFLRDQELKELKRIYCEQDEDKAQVRRHLIKKIDLEQDLAQEEIEQLGKTSLDIELFKLQAERARLQLEHEITLDRIKEAAAKEFRDDKRIETETKLNIEREIKLQEYVGQEEELRLKIKEENAKHEQDMEKIRLQNEHELKTIAALAGLTPETIMAIKDPSVLKNYLEKKYGQITNEEVNTLYKMIIDLKNEKLADQKESMERIVQIHKQLLENKKENKDLQPINKLAWQWTAVGAFITIICVAAFLGSHYLKPKEAASPVGKPTSSPKASRQPGDTKAAVSGKGKGENPAKVTSRDGVVISPSVTNSSDSEKHAKILAEINSCLEKKGFIKLEGQNRVIVLSDRGYYIASATAHPNNTDQTYTTRNVNSLSKAGIMARGNFANWKSTSVYYETTLLNSDKEEKVLKAMSEAIVERAETICEAYDDNIRLAQVVLKIPAK